MKKLTEDWLEILINKQFEIAGHTDMTYKKATEMTKICTKLEDKYYEQIKDLEDEELKEKKNTKEMLELKKEIEDNTWFWKYSTTMKQVNEYREYLKKALLPYIYKQKIDKEIWRFLLGNWLRVTDFNINK